MAYSVNRKILYKTIFKRWDQDQSFANMGLILRYYPDFDSSNFNLAAEYMKIYNSFLDMSVICDMPDLKAVHDKYWDKIIAAVHKKVKKQGGNFPTLSKTSTIRELLSRGFVHREDAKNIKPNRIYIYSHCGELVWDKSFKLHQNALAVMNKVGIPGRTGTKLPKS